MKDISELRAEVASCVERMQTALSAVEEPQEGADLDVLKANFTEAKNEHAIAVDAYDRAKALQEARESLPVEIAEAPSEEREGASPRLSVDREPPTYLPNGSQSIFSDLWRAEGKQDSAARERLERHRSEVVGWAKERAAKDPQSRAAITQTMGEGGELIAPIYLQEKWIGLPRAGRPIANTLNSQPWVQTNSINIPKVKTGTAVAVQTDTGSVESKAMTTELITGQAQTIAGQEDVSQQLVDLSLPGVDVVIFDDLTRALDTQVDVKCIEGTVTNAKGLTQVTGINAITYTEATPKVKEFYKKVAKAIAEVNAGIFLPPTVLAMHPIRWAWLLAASDTAERPLITPSGVPGFNELAMQGRVAAENLVGNMQGLPVVIDASIPVTKGAGTNQDEVYVYRADQLYLWESTPALRIFPEVLSGKLEVRFQLYQYYTIIAGRLPKAISVISGTGLAAPTF